MKIRITIKEHEKINNVNFEGYNRVENCYWVEIWENGNGDKIEIIREGQ